MSVITISEAKSFLDIIHNSDDSKLQLLLDAAEDDLYIQTSNGHQVIKLTQMDSLIFDSNQTFLLFSGHSEQVTPEAFIL